MLVDSFDDVDYDCNICEFVACVLSKEDASPKSLSCLSQAAAYIVEPPRLQRTALPLPSLFSNHILFYNHDILLHPMHSLVKLTPSLHILMLLISFLDSLHKQLEWAYLPKH